MSHMVNIDRIASKVVVGRIAGRLVRDLIAYEFDTPEALKTYLHEHPGADRTKHYVKETEKKSPEQEKSKVTGPTQKDEKSVSNPWKPKKEYKHKVRLSQEELHEILGKGHFSIISAGKNDKSDEKDWDPADPRIVERHHKLMDALEELGVMFTEAIGHYGSDENSLIVMHDDYDFAGGKNIKPAMIAKYGSENAADIRDVLDMVGQELNQNSVLHGVGGGKNEIHFTTGDKKGQKCGGSGFKELSPDEKDKFFTELDLARMKHTRFTLDVTDCFTGGYFD